jgi:hypothetical protein
MRLVLPAWMFDAGICAGMSLGFPRVALSAIKELNRLVGKRARLAQSPDNLGTPNNPGVIGLEMIHCT